MTVLMMLLQLMMKICVTKSIRQWCCGITCGALDLAYPPMRSKLDGSRGFVGRFVDELSVDVRAGRATVLGRNSSCQIHRTVNLARRIEEDKVLDLGRDRISFLRSCDSRLSWW